MIIRRKNHRRCGVATALSIEDIFSVLEEQKRTQMAIYG
jgi:hypothetical protein